MKKVSEHEKVSEQKHVKKVSLHVLMLKKKVREHDVLEYKKVNLHVLI